DKDVAFLRATLLDAQGTTASGAWENVSLGATGDVTLIGENPFSSEAGIASILVQTEVRGPRGAVYGLAIVREGDRVRVLSSAVAVGGDDVPWAVHITTDGSEPGPDAPVYENSFVAPGRVRASLRVSGNAVVSADTDTPKSRIPGSTAPVRP
ncbi:MAG: hypothetical protein LJF04_09060, partial [Gemmatimonadetes bacterium]|nr:hypothetical protein [Gemmatimonadota bacterium]